MVTFVPSYISKKQTGKAKSILLMITKYKGLDPEMETSGVDLNGTPRAKIISMGVNVKL
jgi:hypothetical protein